MLNDNFSLDDNPLWYKDSIIYQVHIKSYRDGIGDGLGDFIGLMEKLDYIESLGITALWLQPFYPSPMKDDGYDISDYLNINRDYGTLDDFKKFVKEAHRRGIRIITELVLNHTSDQHAWFQRARFSPPGSMERNFYIWSDTPDKYNEARIIFNDFETSNWTWDPIAKAYYWHRFYSHQPDLNFENPEVQKNILNAVDFWFKLGVDGMRLDAVPYLFEKDGTNCENLPETHKFLKKLNAHVRNKFNNKMLLAEANQWPEDAVAYFGEGDECHMAFHFPLMPRMFMAIQMETRFPIIDILEQTPPIPDNCQWAMFLRNHDELTLEMVTDEERDYMYRFFAKDSRARINFGIRRRLAPLVDNNRRKIELLNFLLFSFPGTPIIYYGDEIGMGDNYYLGDRNGVRTPMQWSPDRNAGFSSANPQKLFLPVIIDPEYHYEAVNVEIQQRNPSSLLWWMKRAISVRKNYKAFSRGSLEFLSPGNPKILAFLRRYEEEIILVIANLSRFSQVVELDLSQYAGYTPIEVISRNKFPLIKDQHYMFTLIGHAYHWFSLEKLIEGGIIRNERKIPEISYNKNWKEIFEDKEKEVFENSILMNYIQFCDWFDAKDEKIRSVSIADIINISDDSDFCILIIMVNYIDKPVEFYLLPLGIGSSYKAERILHEHSSEILAKLRNKQTEQILFNAVYDENFGINFLKTLIKKKSLIGNSGKIELNISNRIRKYFSLNPDHSQAYLINSDSKEISIQYGEVLNLKLYRRLEEGLNPGEEILHFISEKTTFKNIPQYAGGIYYENQSNERMTIGIFQDYVAHQGYAWDYILDIDDRFYERIISRNKEEIEQIKESIKIVSSFTDYHEYKDSSLIKKYIDSIDSENISLLGKRTGELHLALTSDKSRPSFMPEPFSTLYQRSIYQSIRTLTKNTFWLLSKNTDQIKLQYQGNLTELFSMEDLILNHAAKILKMKISAKKIRVHGDYHLKQVYFTGKDFLIPNFEGPTTVAVTERKLKRAALRDVTGMIWSLLFVAYSSLYKYKSRSEEEVAILEPFAERLWLYMSNNFVNSYYETVKEEDFLPKEKNELEYMLEIYLLEKMLNELSVGLSTNASWLFIPIKGLQHLLKFVI